MLLCSNRKRDHYPVIPFLPAFVYRGRRSPTALQLAEPAIKAVTRPVVSDSTFVLRSSKHASVSSSSSPAAMAGVKASSSGALNPRLLQGVVALMALGLSVYILAPPLYWHVAEALARASSSCPACECDCSVQPLLSLPEELSNGSFTDCARRDPDVSEEMEKNFTDLLAEELKLREAEATEAQRRADVMLLEAKRSASQYQKEADKCSSGMDTCEEARERAEAALLEQKRSSAMWEQRARQQGWKPGNLKSQM